MTIGTTESIGEQLHRQALAASTRAMSGLLYDVLTPVLLAYVTGVDRVDVVKRWATREVTEISDQSVLARLRTAYEMTSLLLMYDAPETIRAWFIGMNELLDDGAPAEAVREGRFDDALGAATNFAAYG